MGQEEVFRLLKKEAKPMSLLEISNSLKEDKVKVCKDLNRMIKFHEVDFIEIDRVEAMKKYSYLVKRRMKLYFVKDGNC